MTFGTHGPEFINNRVYLSIYHYLEFLGLEPEDYNTSKLGSYLTAQSLGQYKNCRYGCHEFSINKFPVVFLMVREHNFVKYLKVNLDEKNKIKNEW